MLYKSGKNIVHSAGLSCVFRQHLTDSHCRFLHGYALQVEFEFERLDGQLDNRNWVMGFGDLKPIKNWLEYMFDHTTLVSKSDPHLDDIRMLDALGLIQLRVVDNTGCEAFAKMIFDYVDSYLPPGSGVLIKKVTVREHESNWASYER